MVNRLTAALAVSLAWPQAAMTKGLPIAVGSVVVEVPGHYVGLQQTDPDMIRSCTAMRLTNAHAALWFRHATEVPRAGFNERATITGCIASGHLKTGDGKKHAWDIDIGGSGVIYLTSKTDAIHLIGPELPLP